MLTFMYSIERKCSHNNFCRKKKNVKNDEKIKSILYTYNRNRNQNGEKKKKKKISTT